MSETVIKVENLGKKYTLGKEVRPVQGLTDRINRLVRTPFKWLTEQIKGPDPDQVLWALEGVSFEVKQGEVLGIIGRNGAGKSTLLKILSRITEPTQGYAEIRGRVGSLLEVGTGMHPELTGRENVYMNATLLGMSKREVDAKFDEIVDFSGIERFIDTSVKRYSSGMRVRLGFAIAAHLEPEVLIVDEVLAVGDIEFQNKCLGKMKDVASHGRTVLFVSHNMGAIQNLCTRGILIRSGMLSIDDRVDRTVREYLSILNTTPEDPYTDNPERIGNAWVRIISSDLQDEDGKSSRQLIAGRSVRLVFRYRNEARVKTANVFFTIYNHHGVAVTHINMNTTNYVVKELGHEGEFICRIDRVPFPEGQYRVAIAIHVDNQCSDNIPNVLSFDVVSSMFYDTGRAPDIKFSACMVDHSWAQETNQ